MISRSSLGICFGAIVASLACGGESGAAGSGGAAATGGATAASGGAPGAGGASGGSSTGGASSTGGSSAGTGGSASGTGGGSSSTSGWDEVRCWQYQEQAARICYGRWGNLWTAVAHACTTLGEPRGPMDLNTTACAASEDSSTPWDETWCDDVQCYGRLGDWHTVLRAPCQVPEGTLSTGTPSSQFCSGAVEAPVGWHDVNCLAVIPPIIEPYCYGFIGLYFPTQGLYPTCYIEGSFPEDPDYTEVTADETVCL